MLCLLASNSADKWAYNISKPTWPKLIVRQIKREYEIRHEELISYHHVAIKLAYIFDGFYISHVSRLQNMRAYALTALAAIFALSADTCYDLTVATRHIFHLKYSLEVSEVHTTSTNFKPRNWHFLIIDYSLHGKLPDDQKEATFIQRRSSLFYYDLVVKSYTAAHMTMYFSAVYPPQKHKKYSKKLMWHIRCLSARSKAQRLITQAWLLLANDDCRYSAICKTV